MKKLQYKQNQIQEFDSQKEKNQNERERICNKKTLVAYG